jgi:hypothetical protein
MQEIKKHLDYVAYPQLAAFQNPVVVETIIGAKYKHEN